MRNNQLDGKEHAHDIKDIIKNHPSLSILDFSNTELNVNKNKLRNVGAVAIVAGILETEGCSLISEINLAYNYLTADSLPFFGKLNNPDFIQLRSLNLSYNDLGPDSIAILAPILPCIEYLNLSNTKMNNQTVQDFVHTFK